MEYELGLRAEDLAFRSATACLHFRPRRQFHLAGKYFTANAMALPSQTPAASPLFLREEEIRRGIELLHFGHAALAEAADAVLARHDLGRAHHRALYFIGRQPDLSVSALLDLLGITKQSLGRVLDDLVARELVMTSPGVRDRRQRLLRLTTAGETVETALFDAIRERMARAYSAAGQGSVTGFWRVLESLLDAEKQAMVAGLQIPQRR